MLLREKEAKEVMDALYEEYVRNCRCVWEEKEEVIEMIIRYVEQAIRHARGSYPELVINPLSFWVRHYIEEEKPHYAFYMKEYGKACSFVFEHLCVCCELQLQQTG